MPETPEPNPDAYFPPESSGKRPPWETSALPNAPTNEKKTTGTSVENNDVPQERPPANENGFRPWEMKPFPWADLPRLQAESDASIARSQPPFDPQAAKEACDAFVKAVRDATDGVEIPTKSIDTSGLRPWEITSSSEDPPPSKTQNAGTKDDGLSTPEIPEERDRDKPRSA